jgi:hypothetical protein
VLLGCEIEEHSAAAVGDGVVESLVAAGQVRQPAVAIDKPGNDRNGGR